MVERKIEKSIHDTAIQHSLAAADADYGGEHA